MNDYLNKIIDKIFDVGVLIKCFFGFFEIAAGFVIAVSGKLLVSNLIIAMTRSEIAEDPNDFFANFLIKMGNSFSAAHFFAVIYLILHGAINIFLGIALLKNKLWAYPLAFAGYGIFIVYQFYRFFYTQSFLLLFLTIFDIFVVLFVFLEYNNKRIKSKQSNL